MTKDSKKKRPKTTEVHENQILDEHDTPPAAEVPETTPASSTGRPRRARPPVRERARTALYERAVPPAPRPAPPPEPGTSRGKVKAVAAATSRPFVELCPFALFQLDTLGNLLWANERFAEFVREDPAELVGKPVAGTRLGVVYPRLATDLRVAAEQVAPPTLKQVVRFEEQDGRTVSWLCWLAPETDAFGEVLRFFGYLHPLQAGGE
jgi:PAS domain-containing protein